MSGLARPTIGWLLVAALVIGAGCQGLSSGAGVGASEVVTPAPVPADSDRTTDIPVDPAAVANQHQDSLAGQSYAVRSTITVRHPNGSVGERRDRWRVGPEGTYTRLLTHVGPYPDTAPNRSAWYDGENTAFRLTDPDGHATVWHSTVPRLPDQSGAALVARLLQTYDPSATTTQVGRRLVATSARPPLAPGPDGLRNERNATLVVSIRNETVRQLRVTYDATLADTDQRLLVRYTLRVDPGGPAPSPPDWVGSRDITVGDGPTTPVSETTVTDADRALSSAANGSTATETPSSTATPTATVTRDTA